MNASGGTIHAPSTGSFTNDIYAPLDNQGTIILDRSMTINKASAAHSNSGTISINSGTLTLTQSGTTPSFTNTGIITADSSTGITINGGSFNYSSGTFTLYGSFSATNVTLDFTPAFINMGSVGLTSSTLSCASTFTNQNALNLTGSTINGNGSLTNSGTMTVRGSTFNLDFDNDGFANFNGTCNINNAFTTQTKFYNTVEFSPCLWC